MDERERRELIKDLGNSFRDIDLCDPLVAKTPKAAIAVAKTYIMASAPPENDSRAPLHRIAMDNMTVLKETLKEKGVEGQAQR